MIFNIIIAVLLLVVGSLVIYSIAQVIGINDWRTTYPPSIEDKLRNIEAQMADIRNNYATKKVVEQNEYYFHSKVHSIQEFINKMINSRAIPSEFKELQFPRA
jgi:ABC-type transport system involved in Fe-S cluster assembly fused permease/ATPase subunit